MVLFIGSRSAAILQNLFFFNFPVPAHGSFLHKEYFLFFFLNLLMLIGFFFRLVENGFFTQKTAPFYTVVPMGLVVNSGCPLTKPTGP